MLYIYIPWEPTTFIFRGYNLQPIFSGLKAKTSIFPWFQGVQRCFSTWNPNDPCFAWKRPFFWRVVSPTFTASRYIQDETTINFHQQLWKNSNKKQFLRLCDFLFPLKTSQGHMTSYSPLNPGCCIGILISWFIIITNWVVLHPQQITLNNQGSFIFFIAHIAMAKPGLGTLIHLS